MANQLIKCSQCGRTFDLDSFKTNNPLTHKMADKHLCFDCVFWNNVLENFHDDYMVISGKLYIYHPILKERIFKNNVRHGKVLFIFRLKDHRVFASKDFRYIGTVPENFRNKLPDQCKQITEDIFFRFQDYQGTNCQAKGCFDRYHCYWYHADQTEPDGPWNIIPQSHKIGDENCESFINKEQLF